MQARFEDNLVTQRLRDQILKRLQPAMVIGCVLFMVASMVLRVYFPDVDPALQLLAGLLPAIFGTALVAAITWVNSSLLRFGRSSSPSKSVPQIPSYRSAPRSVDHKPPRSPGAA